MSLADMSKTTVVNFLANLREEKRGFYYGEPKEVGESIILPLLRETSIKRQYITYPETNLLKVIDSGSISVMQAKNTSRSHVFIRSGSIFSARGGTQERVLQRSNLVFKNTEAPLYVRCIHASRGIRKDTETQFGGVAPLLFQQQVYDPGFAPKDQSQYWQSARSAVNVMSGGTNITNNFYSCGVSGYSGYSGPSGYSGFCGLSGYSGYSGRSGYSGYSGFSGSTGSTGTSGYSGYCGLSGYSGYSGGGSIGSAFGSDDLHAHLEEFAKNYDEILSKVSCAKNQAGIAMVTDDQVQIIEVFDHPKSWKALHKTAVTHMGTELVKEQDETRVKPKSKVAEVTKLVNKVIALNWTTNEIFNHRPSNGEPSVKIVGLSAKSLLGTEFVGEVVEVNNSIIHLLILKKTA